MKVLNKTTILFASAFSADLTEVENAHNSIVASQLISPLLSAPAQTCVGSWKEEGQDKASVELSFVMPVQEHNIGKITSLFTGTYKQEAVLAVNPVDFSAYLINSDGSIVNIGTFQVISEQEAKASECYTFWQNQYWMAK